MRPSIGRSSAASRTVTSLRAPDLSAASAQPGPYPGAVATRHEGIFGLPPGEALQDVPGRHQRVTAVAPAHGRFARCPIWTVAPATGFPAGSTTGPRISAVPPARRAEPARRLLISVDRACGFIGGRSGSGRPWFMAKMPIATTAPRVKAMVTASLSLVQLMAANIRAVRAAA